MAQPQLQRRLVSILASLVLLLSCAGVTRAADADNPLAPADTSSPRATLGDFLGTMNRGHALLMEIVKSYMGSSRLYLSAEERMEVDRIHGKLDIARRTLDLSELPAALAGTLSVYRVLQLKEVLDRLELPPLESVPDAAAMEARQFKRWTVPGTEITIARVEEGPRAGEYLFSPETVQRLPEFYQRIRHLPYQPGASESWYETYRYGGAGMRRIIPFKWMLALDRYHHCPACLDHAVFARAPCSRRLGQARRRFRASPVLVTTVSRALPAGADPGSRARSGG